MATTISGTAGVTFPAGGLGNPAGAVVGTTDTQTLTNKTLGSGLVAGASLITSGTAVASTSGTSIDFTSIPSWVKKITVMFSGVSTNGSSNILVQLGTSGGVIATGYTASSSSGASAVGTTSVTTGFNIRTGAASDTLYGSMVITNITSNTWVSSHSIGSALFYVGGGSIPLGGVLDRVRITTVNGTDTFDAGSINILYE
jgi:hypothetical protein